MQEMPVRQGFLLSKWSDLIGGFPAAQRGAGEQLFQGMINFERVRNHESEEFDGTQIQVSIRRLDGCGPR